MGETKRGGPRVRLTAERIAEMQAAYARGESRPALAARLGIPRSTCDKHLPPRRPDELAAARAHIRELQRALECVDALRAANARLREENEALRAVVDSCS